MTIPSRPAPAPPGAANGQSAVAGANATLEQIRLQLQQQQQMQQQHGNSMQRITIKLPPPPKAPMPATSTVSTSSSTSSITRKFPQARYSPATNWDESPFDAFGQSTNVTAPKIKKPPPPRPPPPRLAGGTAGRKGSTAPPPPTTRPQHSSIITSLFQRNKHKQNKTGTTTTTTAASSAARVYNVSSGNYGSTNSINSGSYKSTTTTKQSANVEWNAAWNTTGTVTTTAASVTARAHTPSTMSATNSTEPQLISFDSPPSSPTFTQKSNSDCLSVDSFSSDSNFSSPNNGSVSQPESGFEDDFSGNGGNGLHRSRPTTTSPLDPWETTETTAYETYSKTSSSTIGTAPVRNIPAYALRTQQTNLQANGNLNGQSTDNPLCNGKSLLPPPTSLNMPTIIKPKISQKPKAPKPPVLHAKPNLMTAAGGNIYGTNLPTPPSPPMPMCAPPPPPGTGGAGTVGISLLDVISGKVDAIHLSSGSTGYVEEEEKPYGIALYDFDGVEEGDLNFRENEKIYLIEQVSDEWYRGRTRSGCEGIFPVNYIDIRVPLQGAALATSGTVNSYSQQWQQTTEYSTQSYRNSSTSTTTLTPSTLPTVRCLYNFPAEVAGDLALNENDYVSIHYRINEDWLYGESNGRFGQFPANFLEYLPDNIPYGPQ